MNTINNLVIFDSDCNFCNSIVNILLKLDKNDELKYTSSDSDYTKGLIEEYGYNLDYSNTIGFIRNGELFSRSTAALRILRLLGFPFNILYILMIIPRSIRDYVYDVISKNRHRLIKGKSMCIVPDSKTRAKFIL